MKFELTEINKKHLRFIAGIFIIPIVNLNRKRKAKWVYIRISLPQFWLMIYRDMDRIEAAKYLEK